MSKPRLSEAVATLSARQREAALADGNVVVLAGPGSGKTRVLTVRAAHLLATSVPRRSALAALTFTNAAADEMRERLGALGLPPSRRVSIGTAHAFCLNEILVNHQSLLETQLPSPLKIMSEKGAATLASRVLREGGVTDQFDERMALTQARRDIALGEAPTGLFVAAAENYTRVLSDEGLLDFEEIIIRSLEAISDPEIIRLVSSRFTHMLVDEYQDLGGVLHAIVSKFQAAGTQVTAVGDPNQSVLGFTGATPTHLLQLGESDDFDTVHLDTNYRSAAAIVSAAAQFIKSASPRQRPARDVEGVIHRVSVEGDQRAHATQAVAVVQRQLEVGVSPSEIAILYPRKGAFLSALLSALEHERVDFFHDRADVIPRGPLARWAARCALRSLRTETPGAELPLDLTIPTLAAEYARLVQSTSRAFKRSAGRQLVEFYRAPARTSRPVSEFVRALDSTLHLSAHSTASIEESDQEDLSRLLALTEVPISHLASSISPNAVTVTTYQSAKGREFDVIIMPGLVEGHVPMWPSTGPPSWLREPPDEVAVAEERRAFYVAVTRARNELHLCTGSGWTNRGGYWELPTEGASRFALELLTHIE